MTGPRAIFAVGVSGTLPRTEAERLLALFGRDLTATEVPGLGDRIVRWGRENVGIIQSSVCQYRDDEFQPDDAISIARDALETVLTVDEDEMRERRRLADAALILAARIQAHSMDPIRSGRISTRAATPCRAPSFGGIVEGTNAWSASLVTAPHRSMLPPVVMLTIDYYRGVRIWDHSTEARDDLAHDTIGVLRAEAELADLLKRIERMQSR
jgi:hypothetical protein